jgi:hypothetical protein
MHVERGNPNEVSGMVDPLSKPTVRKAEPSVGQEGSRSERCWLKSNRKDKTEQIGPMMEISTLKGG